MTKLALALTFAVVIMTRTVVAYAEGESPDISQYARQSDVDVAMSMDAWARYYVGETNLDQLLARDDVNASNRDKLRAFFMLFDQMHESKTFLVAPSSVN